MQKKTITPDGEANDSNPKSESCFTIMPFGGWFDSYYESIYVPAIEAAGLVACRADDLYRPSTIVNDIWSYTQSAKLILADLSGKNPNVFYELGLAHALAKPAILVTESMDDVPFDLRALRVLEYDKNEARWGERLQEKITASIKEVLTSPLQAVLPAFLSVRVGSKPEEISDYDLQLLEVRREIELLRSEVFRRSPRRVMLDESPADSASYSRPPELTPREQEVADLLLNGYTNRDIAQKLGVSANTVEAHLANVMEKYGVNTRTQLALKHSRNV